MGPLRSPGSCEIARSKLIWWTTFNLGLPRVYPCHRATTVQKLILAYEKSVGTAAPSNLTAAFEQVSGDAQYGGAPPSDVLTFGGGGPAAIAAASSRPVVGTPAHNPATHPFGPN
jgi:hypothetical protein